MTYKLRKRIIEFAAFLFFINSLNTREKRWGPLLMRDGGCEPVCLPTWKKMAKYKILLRCQKKVIS